MHSFVLLSAWCIVHIQQSFDDSPCLVFVAEKPFFSLNFKHKIHLISSKKIGKKRSKFSPRKSSEKHILPRFFQAFWAQKQRFCIENIIFFTLGCNFSVCDDKNLVGYIKNFFLVRNDNDRTVVFLMHFFENFTKIIKACSSNKILKYIIKCLVFTRRK